MLLAVKLNCLESHIKQYEFSELIGALIMIIVYVRIVEGSTIHPYLIGNN